MVSTETFLDPKGVRRGHITQHFQIPPSSAPPSPAPPPLRSLLPFTGLFGL